VLTTQHLPTVAHCELTLNLRGSSLGLSAMLCSTDHPQQAWAQWKVMGF